MFASSYMVDYVSLSVFSWLYFMHLRFIEKYSDLNGQRYSQLFYPTKVCVLHRFPDIPRRVRRGRVHGLKAESILRSGCCVPFWCISKVPSVSTLRFRGVWNLRVISAFISDSRLSIEGLRSVGPKVE